MAQELVPPCIQEFLFERVATHEALSALVWLSANEHVAVNSSELSSMIESAEADARDALDELEQAELVVRSVEFGDRYCYAPARSELDASVRLVATFYHEYPVEMVRILAENAMTRLRRAARLTWLLTMSEEFRRVILRVSRELLPFSSRVSVPRASASGPASRR